LFRRAFLSMANSSRPAGSLNKLADDMASSLMRWVCRGDFGRGKNPYFLAFHLLVDAENYELP
ncbi:MAG: hypothetical protein ACOYMC_13815, partial [Pirellulales bacterium]